MDWTTFFLVLLAFGLGYAAVRACIYLSGLGFLWELLRRLLK